MILSLLCLGGWMGFLQSCPSIARAAIDAHDIQFNQNEPPDPIGITITLRTLSLVADRYAQDHNHSYPARITDLTEGNPPYLSGNYCQESVWGYTYECVFSKAGYTLTASPVSPGGSKAPVIIMRTGGLLEPVQVSFQVVAEYRTEIQGDHSNIPAQFAALTAVLQDLSRKVEEDRNTIQNVQADLDSLLKEQDSFDSNQIEEYERLLKEQSHNQGLRLILANLYLSRGETNRAVSLAQEVVSVDPPPDILRKAYAVMIQATYMDGNLQKSYALTEKALKLFPGDRTALSFQKILLPLINRQSDGSPLEITFK